MRPTILIVDDEAAIREALRRTLRSEPYQVLAAGDATEALSVLQDHPVDLILSDQNMPGLTGLELFQRLCADPRHEATIRLLFTGQTDERLLSSALENDVIFHYVHKPWDPDDLSGLLRLSFKHLAAIRDNQRLLALVRAQRKIIADLESVTTAGSAGSAPGCAASPPHPGTGT